MPDFSIILQAPEIRSLVQENLLERAFHDALFPKLLFRGEATPVAWPSGVGDTQIFTAPGLVPVRQKPLAPGVDPTPVSYPSEQWTSTIQQYASTIDTHMPTSIVAIANLFLRNAHQLGLQAGQSLNRVTRNRMYNAALSGHTVIDGAAQTGTTLRVKRLNGFTTARNPGVSGASQVRFDPVSPSNPLAISMPTATPATNTVIGFLPDVAGDETGPGVLTLGAAITVAGADRDAVLAVDRTTLIRVGGGDTVGAVGSTDIPTLADIRAAVAEFWQQNAPEHPDGRFHCHLDPVSQAKIFSDAEFQRLLTALPDYYMYKQFAIGELLNVVFFRNSECPVAETVLGGDTASYDDEDPFAGELFADGTTSGVKVHRMLFTAQGGIMEYYTDLAALITEAGVTGRTGDPRIVNNGIEVFTDRIQLVIRAPQNRLQDQVATTWKFIGDWPVRTDAATGGAARIKRFVTIEHGE